MSLAFMNYEFDIISESNNNNNDTTINDNVLNNFSNEDEIDTVWKPDSSSSNANQFHVSAVNTTSTHSNLRKLLFYTNTNDVNEPNYISRSEDGNGTMIHNIYHTGYAWSTISMNSIVYCVQQSPSIQNQQKERLIK